ncbi:MAG: SGNH/GDSL hydrolase family protein [Chloroflexota bacterium]
MIFEAGQKILFIGDSITDAGRRDTAPPFGDGYVSMVRNVILARYPELRLTFVNRGVSGDTTRHMASRWEKDVIAEQPDWLSVKIGINDVWRDFGPNKQEAVPLAEYVATLRSLLDRTRQATNARLILMKPYMIDADCSNPMRAQMDLYGAEVGRLAEEYGAIQVSTQAAFDDVLARTPTRPAPAAWADDFIHPNGPGHAVIALAFLRAVGFRL